MMTERHRRVHSKMNKKKEFLIKCIQYYTYSPALWDKTTHYNAETKNSCNAKLLHMYRKIDPFATLHTVKRNMRYMITNTRLELKKQKDFMKTGAGADAVKGYRMKWYVPYCKYLAEQEENFDKDCPVDKGAELATGKENNEEAMEIDREMEFTDTNEESANNNSLSVFTPLNKILDDCFSNYPENFNVIHINAHSVRNKHSAMKKISDCSYVHAILISETFLKPCDSSMDYELPGFTLIRCDRTDQQCGGVAIYLRSDIGYSVETQTLQDLPICSTEHLFLKINLPRIKLLLGVFYNPNRSTNYFKYLKGMFNEIRCNFEHIIIMGDFNTDLLKNDTRQHRLRELVYFANLHLLPLKATHYYPNREPSLLDLIIVASLDWVSMYDQFLTEEFLYHHILVLSYKTEPKEAKSEVHVEQNFNKMEPAQLRDAAASIDKSVIKGSRMIDRQRDDYKILDDSDSDNDFSPYDHLKEKAHKKESNDEKPTTSAQAQLSDFEKTISKWFDAYLISDSSDYENLDWPHNDFSKENSDKNSNNDENPSTSAQAQAQLSAFKRDNTQNTRNDEVPTNSLQTQRSALENPCFKKVRIDENSTASVQAQPSTFEKQDSKTAGNKEKPTTSTQGQRSIFKKQLPITVINKENPTTSAQAQPSPIEKQNSISASNKTKLTNPKQLQRSIFKKQLITVKNIENQTTSTQTQPSAVEEQGSENVRNEKHPATSDQSQPSAFEQSPVKRVKLENADMNSTALMNEVQNEYHIWALSCATDLANMRPDQRIYAKKAIAEIIMEGQLGLLHRNALKINSQRDQPPQNSK